MKKPLEELVSFEVKIPKANKSLKLRLTNTTNMLEVQKHLCRLLGLSKNGTIVKFSKIHFPHPISSIHTIRQIGLRNGDVIFAHLESTCAPNRYETGVKF